MATKMSLEDASKAMRDAMREAVKRDSLLYMIQGGLMVLAGVLALIYPLYSSETLVLLLGWLLIISGALQGVSLIGARYVPHFSLQLISVVLAVVIGLIIVRNPGQALLTLVLLLVVFFMVEGISKIVFSLTIRPFPNWGWVLASGVVGLVLAIYLWNTPVTAAWMLGVLIGILLISEGAALGYLAWQIRKT